MRHPTGGFTMIELMVAVAVLGVAIIGTMSAFVTSSQLTALSREDKIAQQVADREMAALRARGYTWLDNEITSGRGPTRPLPLTLNTHEQSLLVAPPPPPDGPSQGQRTLGRDGNLVVITVRVNWSSTALSRTTEDIELSVTRETKVAP